MARNQEKAQSMLNRFITKKEEEKQRPIQRRPYLASQCRNLSQAKKWRQQIMRDIGSKVFEIQNEGLGEHILRDLNDEINHLIREKFHWERRIIELGGLHYIENSTKITDLDGNNIVSVSNSNGRGPGYRYFGAAKNLAGVRELFEKPPESKRNRPRYLTCRGSYGSYYGLRDDEDGILEKLERLGEEKVSNRRRRGLESGLVAANFMSEGEEDNKEIREEEEEFTVHVPLLDDNEIKRMSVEKKKKEMLEQQSEAKAMLNILC